MEGRRPEGGGVWRPTAPAAEATTGAAAAARATRQHHQQVKVKHIVTREVSTDQASFKDVVQRLTGKDSAAARAAVVAAGADGTSSSWSGGAAVATGTGAAGVVPQDNVVVDGAIGVGAAVSQDNVAWAMLPPSSEEDTKQWWRGA